MLFHLNKNVASLCNNVIEIIFIIVHKHQFSFIPYCLTDLIITSFNFRIIVGCAIAKNMNIRFIEEIRLRLNIARSFLCCIRKSQTMLVQIIEKFLFC